MLSDGARVALLAGGCALLWSAEALVPLRSYAAGRWRRAAPNVALALMLVATNLLFSFAAAAAAAWAEARGWGLLPLLGGPAWVAALLGVAALDGFAYLAHRALHAWPAAWRFHRVHHCEEEVDVTTAFRQHPGETVWRIAWQLPPILLLGLPLWVVGLYLALSAANAQLEHANLRVPPRLDGALRLLVVTPDMHKVHHSRRRPETDSNYANLFSFWDRLFGTYTPPVPLPQLRYGLDGLAAGEVDRLGVILRLPFVEHAGS